MKKVRDIIPFILVIIALNTIIIMMVMSGNHIALNTISWVSGFVTVFLLMSILRKLNVDLNSLFKNKQERYCKEICKKKS